MATGALADSVTETVAEELENAAIVTRRIDGRLITFFLLGAGVGATIGFVIGYRYSKKKLRSEILAEAEKEIEDIRELYRQKTVAAEAQTKPSVEEIIQERGYVFRDEVVTEEERPTRPPVPTEPPRVAPRVLPTPIDPNARIFRTEAAQKDKDDGWDYETEESFRGPHEPYIIHQDEYTLNESGYSQVSYIYYSIDDVLVDEDDPQNILNNRENLIGDQALDRFGHGADDYNLVHVRNPELQLEFVINRVSESWEEEVLGLQRDDPN